MPADPAPAPMQEILPSVQDRGNPLARLILRLAGWHVAYRGTPPGCGVIIAYPHTSNWDFVIGILARSAIGIPIAFLAKDSLFRKPLLGGFLRACGGIAVDRSSAHGLTTDMAERIRQTARDGRRWWLVITPEGTRRATPGWRAGFYHLALAAQVPIGLAFFHYGRREIGVTTFLQPSGDAQADLRQIGAWYAEHGLGRHPQQASPVQFWHPH